MNRGSGQRGLVVCLGIGDECMWFVGWLVGGYLSVGFAAHMSVEIFSNKLLLLLLLLRIACVFTVLQYH